MLKHHWGDDLNRLVCLATSTICAAHFWFPPPAISAPAPDMGERAIGSTEKMKMKSSLADLRSVAEAAGKARRACVELYKETRRSEADLVDETDVMEGSIFYAPMDTNAEGDVPPRKKWVDRYMDEMGKFLMLLHDDVTTIKLPDAGSSAAASYLKDLQDADRDTQYHFKQLVSFTENEPYDVPKIRRQCRRIEEDLKTLDETRKKLRATVSTSS